MVTLINNILEKHSTKITKVEIIPSTGGIFDIYLDNKIIFSKNSVSRMPNENEIENIIDKTLNK